MKVGGNVTPITLARLAILFSVLLLARSGQTSGLSDVEFVKTADTKTSADARTLKTGEVLADTVSTGETRVYAFNSDQDTLLEISKGDLRLKITLCNEQSESCIELMPRRFGKVSLPLSPVRYRVEIASMEKEAAARKYELLLSNTGKKTPHHELAEDALRIEAEAEKLRAGIGLSSQLIAAAKFAEAARLWESAGEFNQAVLTMCETGDVYFTLSQYPQALTQYNQALSLSTRGDPVSRLAALHGIGYIHVTQYKNQEALRYAKDMQDLIDRANPAEQNSPEYLHARAQALNINGEVQYNFGELQRAIKTFETALSLFTDVGDRSGQALALLNLGYTSSDSGNPHVAFKYYQDSLTSWQSIDDGRGIALAQDALGGAYSTLGEEQLALNLHKQAVEHFRAIGNKQGEAMALNGVGTVYQDLNQYQEAFDKYFEALRIYESIGNRGYAALNKYSLGKMLYLQGQIEPALIYYRESLFVGRDVKDKIVQAHASKGLGTVYFARGDTKTAIKYFEESREAYRASSVLKSEAYVLNDIGHVYAAAGDVTKALASYAEALSIMQRISERRGEALTLFNIAKAEFGRGNSTEALDLVEKSISISESLRTKIQNSKLRTSFFASVYQQYQLYIDVLMRLHTQQPDKGFNLRALVASERARARSLLDSLLEERVASGKGLTNELFQKEQELLQTLDEKAERQTRILANSHTEEQANEIAREIRTLTIEFDDVRSKLREQSPRLATLTQPDQLRADDIRAVVNDNDTTLLEFTLGDERSYLWVVKRDGVYSYELPARETIETLARRIYQLLTARQLLAGESSPDETKLKELDAEYWMQAGALSTMVLGPAADKLNSNRLLIVSDGFLRYIPFEALPKPNSTASADPLFLDHEIVGLPSALILAALRSEKSVAEAPTKTIAVIADPVFEKEDPRVVVGRADTVAASGQTDETYLASSMRDFDEADGQSVIRRLPATVREVQAITATTPREQMMVISGFAATKERIARDELKDFRIIHFATHGLLNNNSPELSGIVLSLVDELGEKRSGFFRLNDIYSMTLSADLVVLSACRTGLGRNVQGEGIVGLTSGFMYAGAKSVIASLWKVDDEATAELMGHFYTALFKNGLTPAAALNAAKREMWKQPRWRAPYYWAAFTLQGEYTTQVTVANRSSLMPVLVLIGGLAVVVLGILRFTIYRRSTS
jgi:CHAT domain-containing protein